MKNNEEYDRLEKIAVDHDYTAGFNGKLTKFRFQAMKDIIGSESKILELGPAEGSMTSLLSTISTHISVVDASKTFIEKIKLRLPNIKTYCNLFEDVELEETYDVILIMHVLEHVVNPVDVLKHFSKSLSSNGKIIISVPNANSLHRLLGVKMNLLKDVHELSEGDHQIGHRRVYDFESLELDIKEAGLTIIDKKSVFIKPFANGDMDKLTDEQLEGLFKLSSDFPFNGAELFFTVTR